VRIVRNCIDAVISAVILFLGLGCPLTFGQNSDTTAAGNKSSAQWGHASADVAAIFAGSEAFVAAFNNRDAQAIAALWTEDGDCVDDTGKRFRGRAEIEKVYAELFKARPGSKIKIVVDSLRVLSPDAALEDGHAILDPAPPGPPAINKYTAVHIKADGKWLMSSVRETRVETHSGYPKVADLEWLIGTWTAEEHGAKTISVCRWIANKSFVERTYTVTHPDHTTTSGVQLIGFNAERDRIQSWNFSPDGGHAIGLWTPRDKGWAAEIRGVSGDGTITTAVNLLTKVDDNAYIWQSVQRTAGGATLPDTEEVVLKRNSRAR
jgi:uncharacterized protein (TIGR02246 family)